MEFLTTTEELELKKAVELFYEEGKYLEAYNLAFPVWEKHKTDETVQDTFWQIAAKLNKECATLIQDFGDDIPFYIGVACTLYFIRANEFDMAERRIKAAKQVEDDEGKFSINIRYNEFLLNLALFKKYNDKSFLDTAEKIMADEFTERGDKLENSWKIVLLNELNKCNGEEPMKFDKEFCKENKLYYDFVNSDVFAFGINTSMDFVTVDGGTYTMGNEQTPAECRLKATVGDMYVCKHPVTQKEYSYIMGKDSCIVNSGGEFPVTDISWYDAIEYCNKRSLTEGFTPYYNIDKEHKAEGDKFDKICWTITENNDSDGYRLPTQEEWEYVARGGKLSKGYKFAGSNVLDEVAFTGLDFNRCPEICQKKPNELGIFDMGGLVSEFCYPRRIIQFKDGTTQFRIRAKGNSYVEIPDERFAGYREDHWYVAKGIESDGGDYPYSKYEFYGVRVVRSKLK